MINSNSSVAQKNVTNVRLIVLLVLLFLSSVGVFGQNKPAALSTTTSTEIVIATDVTITVATDNAVASTSTDFALWFMGNKQTTSSKSNATIGKKQFITSGISPNTVLIKTFMKRVANQVSNVA